MENIISNSTKGTKVNIDAVIKNNIYFNDSNDFGVYNCCDKDGNKFVITGKFPYKIISGQSYGLTGIITERYGEKQLNVKLYHPIIPFDENSIISYLQSLDGLGKKAQLIYDNFKDKSIEILKNKPEEVVKIRGIGEKSALKWSKQLKEFDSSQTIMLSLLNLGLSVNAAKELYDQFGDTVVSEIYKNPFMLARKVKGYGFTKCDKIAEIMDIDPKSCYRIQEGIIYALNEATDEGHCFLPIDELIKRSKYILDKKMSINEMRECLNSKIPFYKSYKIDLDKIKKLLELEDKIQWWDKTNDYRYVYVKISEDEIYKESDNLYKQNRIKYDGNNIYLTNLYIAENESAKKLKEIISNERPRETHKFTVNEYIDHVTTSYSIKLEKKQKDAIEKITINDGGVFILNGSAGSGKTFTISLIIEILKLMHKSYKIKVMAPTGKAAKVASKATNTNCETIHRGLKYNPFTKSFMYNRFNNLEEDCIIIDESSMIDIDLFYNLLMAIKPTAKVIFIGDTNQLPSVGPGNVLHDMIISEDINVSTLDVIKRQSANSGIIENANNIINCKMIYSTPKTNDFFIIKEESPKRTDDIILKLVNKLIKIRKNNINDVQVLCPQKNGIIGSYYLNYLLQKQINNLNSDDIKYKTIDIDNKPIDIYFRKGDKVINIKNDYGAVWYHKNKGILEKDKDNIGIFNGDCGIIDEINKISKEIIVKYDEKYIKYDRNTIEEIDLAYALTIHKSQGSEWDYVIIPIMNKNFRMLERNLLYTGISRGSKGVTVIGQERAIRTAIKTNNIKHRYTNLANKI